MITIFNTDIFEALKKCPDNYFDGFFADAPYGLSFMGKEWDDFSETENSALGKQSPANKDNKNAAFKTRGMPIRGWSKDDLKTSNTNFYNFVFNWSTEVLRVLKPGAFFLCYGGTRTYHRLTCAIEDAGFEIRDCLMWLQAQGFPKSHNFGCRCNENRNRMQDLSQKVSETEMPYQESDEQLLLKTLRGDRESQDSSEILSKRKGEDKTTKIREQESLMEGRDNLFSETRKLQIDKIREMSDGVSSDGKKGWLRDGTQIDNGSNVGKIIVENGGSSSHQPQSTGQPQGESSTIPKQLGTQKIREGLCPKCGGVIGFEGFGTALKPAYEPIVLAMKPIEKTYAENALKWGTGGLNIDGTRIETNPDIDDPRLGGKGSWKTEGMAKRVYEGGYAGIRTGSSSKGRFPANLLLTHHPDCKLIGVTWRMDKMPVEDAPQKGEEVIGKWECHPDCPIGQLNESVGIKKSGDVAGSTRHTDVVSVAHGKMKGVLGKSFADIGFVSRFFYNGKVSRKERELGLDALALKVKTEEYAGMASSCKICGKMFLSGTDPCTCDESIYGSKAGRMINTEFHNNHPTLKPILLNQYLAKLILPPAGGKLLNAFSGTSSEAIGAHFAGWNEIVCIEKEAEYVKIAEARVKYWTQFKSYEEALNAKKKEDKFVGGGL